MAHIPANVERGAALLDERLGPDWDEQIDLNRLDLSSNCNCIVGQLNPAGQRLRHKRYWQGIEELNAQASPERLGFNLWGRQTWDALTAGWVALILGRRRRRRG